jgi:hypothetical protein
MLSLHSIVPRSMHDSHRISVRRAKRSAVHGRRDVGKPCLGRLLKRGEAVLPAALLLPSAGAVLHPLPVVIDESFSPSPLPRYAPCSYTTPTIARQSYDRNGTLHTASQFVTASAIHGALVFGERWRIRNRETVSASTEAVGCTAWFDDGANRNTRCACNCPSVTGGPWTGRANTLVKAES